MYYNITERYFFFHVSYKLTAFRYIAKLLLHSVIDINVTPWL